jgi:hypothetical protein
LPMEACAAATATATCAEGVEEFVGMEKELVEAVRRDDPTEEVLADVASSKGFSCMHIAACLGSMRCLEEMVKRGADVNVEDGEGNTPLHHAVRERKVLATVFLLAHGANVNAIDHDDETPLVISILQRDKDTTAVLLSREDIDVRVNEELSSQHSQTPLTAAIEAGDLLLAKALIERGSTLNPRSRKMPCPPLHFAVLKSNRAAVRLLVESGASVNTLDSAGRTPRDVAISAAADAASLGDASAAASFRMIDRFLCTIGGFTERHLLCTRDRRLSSKKSTHARLLRMRAIARSDLEATLPP